MEKKLKKSFQISYIEELFEKRNLKFNRHDFEEFIMQIEEIILRDYLKKNEIYALILLFLYTKKVPIFVQEIEPEMYREITKGNVKYKVREYENKLKIKYEREGYFRSLVRRVIKELEIPNYEIPYTPKVNYFQYILDYVYYKNDVSYEKINEYCMKITGKNYGIFWRNVNYFEEVETVGI